MRDNADVAIGDVNVLFGEVYRVGKELFGNGRVEVFHIKYGEGVMILCCMLENQLITDDEFFHW